MAEKVNEPPETVRAELIKICNSAVSRGERCIPKDLPFDSEIGRAFNIELLKLETYGDLVIGINNTVGKLLTGGILNIPAVIFKGLLIATAPKEDGTQFIMASNLAAAVVAAALTQVVGGQAVSYVGHLTLAVALGFPNAKAALTEGCNALSQLHEGNYSDAAWEASKCLLHGTAVVGCCGLSVVTAYVYHTHKTEIVTAIALGVGIDKGSKCVWDRWENEITKASDAVSDYVRSWWTGKLTDYKTTEPLAQ